MELKILEALLLVCLYFFVVWLGRRTVRIYGHNQDGKCIFIGVSMIKAKEDCFEIMIKDSVIRRNYTDVYDLLIGDFRVGRYDETVVVVRTGRHKTAVGAYLLEEVLTIDI